MDATDSSNWIKLQMLLNHANATLQELFIASWKINFACDWDKSQASIIKNRVKNMSKSQQKSIDDGVVSNWDITTLRAILFADSFLDLTHDQKDLIMSIVDIRNKIYHLPSNAVSQEQFEEWWKALFLDLVGLGASETELEQLKVGSRLGGIEIIQKKEEIINEANRTSAALLKEEGNAAFKNENHSLAIELFTQGINLPEISNRDRAVLLSNRVASYLKLYESSQDNKFLLNGKEDAEAVISLWPEWWRGYYRLGLVHMGLRQYQKAIEYLNAAFAKEPQIKEIADLLSNATRLLGEDDRMEYFDPYKQGLSTADIVSIINKRSGLTMSVSDMKNIEALNDKMGMPELENLELCRKGHRCRVGTDGFPRDFREAAKYYKTAADRGSTGGMYNLGLLYFGGQGVKQDFDEALKLYEKAAAQLPYFYIGEHHIPNIGVAEAQHALGTCYAEGTGVVKSLSKAMHWYQTASDNGCARAANNLGLMYENGVMDKKPDLAKAEEYYRIAANHAIEPDSNAMLNMAFLYRKKGDFQRALDWCHRAEKNGNLHPNLYALKSEIKEGLHFFEKEKIADWESENGKSCDGLTILQRMKRYFTSNNEKLYVFMESFDIYRSKLVVSLPSCISSSVKFDPQELQNCANHSEYGQTLWTAKNHCLNALYIMTNELMDCETLPVSRCKVFIEEISAGLQIEILVFHWPSDLRDQAVSIVNLLLIQKTPFDEDVRICYVGLHSVRDPPEAIIFLDECIRLYPKNVYFLKNRAWMKAFLNSYEEGILDTKLALKLNPEDIEILYDQAAMTRLTGTLKAETVIEAYRLFLKLAPKDHRKVPESFYSIALTILVTLKEFESIKQSKAKEDLAKIKHHYDLGKDAEKDQLSFFLPYESTSKATVELLFPAIAKRCHSSLSLSCTYDPSMETESFQSINYLTDPDRKLKIRTHRSDIHYWKENATFPRGSTVKPPKEQLSPKSLADLTSISFDGMGPNMDFVHEGFILATTIIDDVCFTGHSVCLLLGDRNGCVERCFIYNLPYMNDITRVKTVFSPGCKLSIINPNMRMATEGKPAIRVDDPASIVFEGKIPKMCRYCCKPNANHLCGRCRIASYCDENCQTVDWKEMQHKLVCEPLTT